MKAFILAAGLGTRLGIHTHDKPKALVQLAGKPLIQHAIEKLVSHQITDITINVFHFADQLIAFFDHHKFPGVQIHLSDERPELLDTGGGLKKAEPFLKAGEPILIYNVDIISNLDLNLLLQFHLEQKALATLAVRNRMTSRYLMIGNDHQLAGWKNFSSDETIISRSVQFTSSQPYAFCGIHIVQPEIFSLMTETGKFSIMDLYLRLARTEKILAYFDPSDIWMDLGKPDQLELADALLSK